MTTGHPVQILVWHVPIMARGKIPNFIWQVQVLKRCAPYRVSSYMYPYLQVPTFSYFHLARVHYDTIRCFTKFNLIRAYFDTWHTVHTFIRHVAILTIGILFIFYSNTCPLWHVELLYKLSNDICVFGNVAYYTNGHHSRVHIDRWTTTWNFILRRGPRTWLGRVQSEATDHELRVLRVEWFYCEVVQAMNNYAPYVLWNELYDPCSSPQRRNFTFQTN